MIFKENLPYFQIPKPAIEYTAGATASRMIDGLGFRYYWATEGLSEKDLIFQPNSEARTVEETLDHIYNLSIRIINAALLKVNGDIEPIRSFGEKRKKTLENLLQASTIFRESKDVAQFKILFPNKELSFWCVINGPIADAIWHVGQIVSFRRSSGNPFPNGVNVLTGKKQD
ncbi:hypothetical protein [Polaribacter sp. Q13]|uniref:hypothetical protein n=1 Tax=Polaribacter sp. Q13 TaxID=2806551 RepID=UPI00193B3994|nr:hypothetical protein [Polaribacter sp. Q13]QVY65727.1 hypothetical protein JOP69_00060 [Polaribacter sp. Q13]